MRSWKQLTLARALPRIALVLTVTGALFLTLAAAGRAADFGFRVLRPGSAQVSDFGFRNPKPVLSPAEGPEIRVATSTLTADTEVGHAMVTATAGSAVGAASLEVVPEAVGRLRVTPGTGTQTAGEAVELRAEVFDGNPVEAGIPVSFTTTLGEIQPPLSNTDAAGVVTATLVSTRTGTAIVSAYAAGVRGTAAVLFTPGPPESITLTADPPAIPVDGAKSQIVAILADRYDNRVGDGITVTFDSSLGVVIPVTTTTVAGRTTTVLTSGAIHGQATVTATTLASLSTGVRTYTGTTQVELLPADLRIQSAHSPTGEILPGTAVTYTITYTNAGHALARNVVITDALPIGFIDTTFESSGAIITATEGTKYTWQVEDLSPGEGGTIVLRGRFDPRMQWPASQFVANVATIESSTAEGHWGDNSTAAGNTIVTANIHLQGAVDPGGTDLNPGGKIKYRVFYGNDGPALAQGLIITSTLPAYTSLWDWNETGLERPGLIHVSDPDDPVQVWRYDGIVDGPNFGVFYIWLNIDANAPGGAFLRHRIEVSTNTPESNYTDNVQVIERRVSGVNLEVLLMGPATVIPDQIITYTLRYTNTGTVAAEGVTLTDTLPPGVSLINVSLTPSRIEPGRIEWDLGSVPEGRWRQIDIIGRVGADVRAGQTLHNALSITTTSAESYTGDNTSAVDTQVIPDVPASLALLMEPTTVAVGSVSPLLLTLTDQFGNPIDGATVTLTTTVGIVTPTLLTTVQGAATATFTAPTSPGEGTITAIASTSSLSENRVRGPGLSIYCGELGSPDPICGILDPRRRFLRQTARLSPGFKELSDAVDVVVEPGQPSSLELQVEDGELPADGVSTTVMRAYVTDKYGNPVKDGTPVTFETNRGTLYNDQARHVVGTFEGIASTVLRTGRSPGRAIVTASAGAASAQNEVEFVAVPEYKVLLPFITRNLRGY